MPADLASLKRRIDMRSVVPVTSKRTEYGNYERDLCPFHAEDRPSFLIYADGYHCLSRCGSGDIFDYLRLSTGLPFSEVIRQVEELAGGQATYVPTTRDKKPRRVDQSLAERLHVYGMSQDVFSYYTEYLGFLPETIFRFRLGYGCLPGSVKVGEDWLERSVGRFTIPTYRWGRLVNIKARRDDRCRLCGSWQTEVVLVDGEMHIACGACDSAQPHPDPEALSKYTSLKDAERTLFNADDLDRWALAPPDNEPRQIALVEGEYKAIAIEQAGLTCVSFGASKGFPAEWAVPLLAATDGVLLIADNDPAGEDAVRRILYYVPHAKVVYLPNQPKGDAQEYLRDFGRDAFFSEIERQMMLPHNRRQYRLLKGQDFFVPRIPPSLEALDRAA